MAPSVSENLLQVALTLAEGLDRATLVQRVTDEATRLSGAQFGAFFYNVHDGRRGAYTLYTLSGAPREAFSRFPMPRATNVFAPTFEGTDPVVRSDDITRDPRYGKNAPNRGMPEGHLPVRSYLAVSVRGTRGTVLGGLFFGHSEVGRFTKEHEDLVVGIARLAAPALENAHLHEQVESDKRRYELINRATNDAVWDWDLLHDRIEWNDAVQTLFHYDASEIGPGGDWWKEHIHPADHGRVVDGIHAVIDGGEDTWSDEYRFKRKDGSYADIFDRGYVIRDETGRAVRMVGSMLDLSARRRLEHQLAASQERLRLAVEASGVGTWDFHPETRALTWDDRCRALFGLSPGAPVDYDLFLRTLHPDDRQRADDAVQRALDPTTDGRYQVEYRAVGIEDGIERWISAEGRAYFDASRTRAVRFIGTVLDITERKQLEARLAMQNKVTRTITSNASLALFMMDERQHCTFMNPAAETMTGFTFDEVLRRDRPLHDIIHHLRPDGRPYPLDECPIDRALPTRARERGEDVFVRRDGTFYPVAFIASPIVENGRPIGTVIEVQDLTDEKRRAAEAAEATRAREASEARFRRIFESNVVGFLFTTLDGKIVDANDYFLELVGHSRADVLEGSIEWRALTPPEHVAASERALHEAEKHGRSAPFEKEYIRRDGMRVPSCSVRRVYRPARAPTSPRSCSTSPRANAPKRTLRSSRVLARALRLRWTSRRRSRASRRASSPSAPTGATSSCVRAMAR